MQFFFSAPVIAILWKQVSRSILFIGHEKARLHFFLALCKLTSVSQKRRASQFPDTWRMWRVNSTTCVPLPANETEFSAEIGNESEPLKQSVELSLALIKLTKVKPMGRWTDGKQCFRC